MSKRGFLLGLVAALAVTAVGLVLEHLFGLPPYLTGFWSGIAAMEVYRRYG